MKALLASLVLAASIAAHAQTTEVLPNPDVTVGLSIYGNACSFSNPKVKITVTDPAIVSDPSNPLVVSGPVTAEPVYQQSSYGRYIVGDIFSGTFTAPDGQTVSYSQMWDLRQSGGRGHTCWFAPAAGELTVN